MEGLTSVIFYLYYRQLFFWRLVAPAIQLVVSDGFLLPGTHRTPKNHAARARPSYALLSLAFVVFWPLSHRISLKPPYYTKIEFQGHPHHRHTGYKQCWRTIVRYPPR